MKEFSENFHRVNTVIGEDRQVQTFELYASYEHNFRPQGIINKKKKKEDEEGSFFLKHKKYEGGGM